MARNSKSFRLWCRKDRGGVHYMKLPGGEWESTGCMDPGAAEKRAIQKLGVIEHAAVEGKSPISKADIEKGGPTVREYSRDFFLWRAEKPPVCPWCTMKLAEGKQIGPEHAKRQRRLLERFILTDPIADMPMRIVRRAHVMDFRSRLLVKLGANVADEDNSTGKRTASLALAALSAIFALAVARDELDSNPCSRVTVKAKSQPRGTLSLAELRNLFPYNPEDLGPWRDLRAKTAFLTAGTCGLRRNEIRALRWDQISLADSRLKINTAFKGNVRRGKPKWNKTREAALPHVVAMHLKALGPGEGLVFHHADGSPLGTEWWKLAFLHAMKEAKINAPARNIVPHSLRHSAASELRAAGVSDALLEKTFGWRDEATRERYAGHLDADRLRQPAKVIDSLFGEG